MSSRLCNGNGQRHGGAPYGPDRGGYRKRRPRDRSGLDVCSHGERDHSGAEPVFVDVTVDTWTLDPDLVRETLSSSEKSISAVMPVHVLGHPVDIDALAAVVGDVPDRRSAIGALYKGGTLETSGSFPLFSFNGNKTVTAGGGGMVLTDDEETAYRIRHLSTQARVGADYLHDAVGFNYRMTNQCGCRTGTVGAAGRDGWNKASHCGDI